MCGIIGIFNFFPNTKINKDIQEGLEKIQSRGQDGYGYYLEHQKQIYYQRFPGKILPQTILNSYQIALGQNRYPTSYGIQKDRIESLQPFIGHHPELGKFIMIHNGNINQLASIQKKFQLPEDLEYENDSHLLVKIIEHSNKFNNIRDILVEILENIPGVYNILVYFSRLETLYGIKDRTGNRPLCVGINRRGICITSESVALGNYEYEREINAGEIVKVDHKGLESIYQSHQFYQNCIFEYIYLMRQDSLLSKIEYETPESRLKTVRVLNLRQDFGRELGRQETYKITQYNRSKIMVIGAPQTGIPIGEAYAESLDIPYGQYLFKNKKAQRSFILADNTKRKAELNKKFGIDTTLSIQDKIVFFVDDSLVRGNTIQTIVDILKSGNPAEIHIRIASPPVKFPCYYGIDIPKSEELVMSHYEISELEQKLDITSLKFLKPESMAYVIKKNLNFDQKQLCMGCFTGKYHPLLEF